MFGLKIQHRMQFLPRTAVFGFVFQCVQLPGQLLHRCHGTSQEEWLWCSYSLYVHLLQDMIYALLRDLKSIIPGSWVSKFLHFPPPPFLQGMFCSAPITSSTSSYGVCKHCRFSASLCQHFPPQNWLSEISPCSECCSGFLFSSLRMVLCAIWSILLFYFSI